MALFIVNFHKGKIASRTLSQGVPGLNIPYGLILDTEWVTGAGILNDLQVWTRAVLPPPIKLVNILYGTSVSDTG